MLLLGLALGAGCSDDESSGDGPKSCDPEAPACDDGLICVPQEQGSALCQIPPGAACDPELEQSNCRLGSECVENPEAADDEEAPGHVCLVAEAGECDPLEPFCAEPLTCAAIEDGEVHRCYAPVPT